MEMRTIPHIKIVRISTPFFVNVFTFLNACISVKPSAINTKLGDFVNLGMLFLTM